MQRGCRDLGGSPVAQTCSRLKPAESQRGMPRSDAPIELAATATAHQNRPALLMAAGKPTESRRSGTAGEQTSGARAAGHRLGKQASRPGLSETTTGEPAGMGVESCREVVRSDVSLQPMQIRCSSGGPTTRLTSAGVSAHGPFLRHYLTRRSRNQEVGADWVVWKRPMPARLPSRLH